MYRTPTDIEVTVVDFSDLEKLGLETALKEKRYKDTPPTACKVNMSWGIVEAEKGLYIMCTEGVGMGPITEDNPYKLELWLERRIKEGEDRGWFSVMPTYSVNLDGEDLRERATGAKINLVDFVRRFGARLESNYESLRRELENGGW